MVVRIQKHGSPSQVLRVDDHPCGERLGAGGSGGMIAIKGSRIVREVGLGDVQVTVPIVIPDGRTHAGLFPAIFIEGNAGIGGSVREGSVTVVVIENRRRRIAGYVD